MYKTILHTYKYIDINNIEREHTIVFSPIVNDRELYPPASMYKLQGAISTVYPDYNNMYNVIPLEKSDDEIGYKNFLYEYDFCNHMWGTIEHFFPYKCQSTLDEVYVSFYSLLEFLHINSKFNKEKPSYEDLDEIWDYYHNYTLDEWNEYPDDYFIYTLTK